LKSYDIPKKTKEKTKAEQTVCIRRGGELELFTEPCLSDSDHLASAAPFPDE
jgi:hypothetical protein